MKKQTFHIFNVFIITSFLFSPFTTLAATTFDPHFIVSDEEIQDCNSWSRNDISAFLHNKNSYLSNYVTVDYKGLPKTAADIIYDASKNYNINPKYLLVTLQKEQSLITDPTPEAKQLDWATGYAVCDSCDTSDPKLEKYKGFGKQVDNSAGLMRWYYDNQSSSIVKKKDQETVIDGQSVIPKSWATAFLYTYTPHLHGNENFWKIWQEWFQISYPNGTLLKSASSSDVWLVQNNTRRKFKNQSVLISRADPKMIITVTDAELSNYKLGADITFPNYSLLKTAKATYLLDYDTLRPFASDTVVKKIGYNPEEIITVNENDLIGLAIGSTITEVEYAPQGIIYQITDYNNSYYLIKNSVAYSITDKGIVQTDYKTLTIEKHVLADLNKFKLADSPLQFKDGTLFKSKDSNNIYVMEDGKKRKFADEKTFLAMGYKKENVISVDSTAIMTILNGESIYYSGGIDVTDLNKTQYAFLGDAATGVKDLYGTNMPAYIVAEYPSGKVIAGKNIDTKRPIASFTKTFVGFEILQQGFDQNKTSVYDSKKYGAEGYSLAITDGTKITNKDVLNTMLIGSYNNVARLAVQTTGLTEKQLVEKINQRFKEWGASNSSLDDVSGLSEKNVSTPRDLLKLFTYSLEKSFDVKNILGKQRHDFGTSNGHYFSIKNTNSLAFNNSNYEIISSKTGYTEEAGAVLFLLIKSTSDNKKYVVITMGNSDYNNRFVEPDKIAKWISTQDLTIAGTK